MASSYFADITVFDGARVRAHQGVLVDRDRIAWTGPHARAPREARAAREVGGPGRALTPGLIDCHVHLCFDGGADFAAEAAGLTPALGAIKGTVNARKHLVNGVTTVRDLGGIGIVELAGAIEAGIVPGPTVIPAGSALTITGGHGHNIGIARQVDGADAIRRAVREEIRAGALTIKLIATGGVLTPGIGATFAAFTPEELTAAIEEAHSRDRGVAAHAIGADGILQAVLAGVDTVEHCVQVTPRIAKEMAARGTFRGPTISALMGIAGNEGRAPAYAVAKAQALVEEAKAGHARSIRAGVRHICSTDAGTPFNPHGNAPNEVIAMIDWGMAPLAAMVAATANGAEALRIHDVGRIAPGMRADLVLYDVDPVEDPTCLREARAVWKDGARVRL
ncbi:MAG: amidohydrolase family protein [Actinobacteria bacterium]|nr:MAG: amidohydrolase family protein [Actinomycetota bacterium]